MGIFETIGAVGACLADPIGCVPWYVWLIVIAVMATVVYVWFGWRGLVAFAGLVGAAIGFRLGRKSSKPPKKSSSGGIFKRWLPQTENKDGAKRKRKGRFNFDTNTWEYPDDGGPST